MKIIIPMAGMGKRMRPHTLTVPKPLIKIAGKPIVHRLAESISQISKEPIEEIAFIIGDFGHEVEQQLLEIATTLGAKGSIYYQEEALGTAHAVLCAANALQGEVIIAFADTLFKANFELDKSKDSIIWVHQVNNPQNFGVVKINEQSIITDFIEKPKTFVSDLAIIGIYYFKDGLNLRNELQYLIDNNICKGGEYQLTDALENMKNKNLIFSIGKVEEWLDCGNKDATVYTNQRILELHKNDKLIDPSLAIKNAVIIPPCYIGKNVVIKSSVVGPHVSVCDDTIIEESVVTNSIIQSNTHLSNVNIDNSMVGSYVEYKLKNNEVSIGDYTILS